MKKLVLSSLLVLAVVLAGPAQAVLVKNITTDTVLFYDDFEGVTGWTGGTGEDNDPVAVTGTWTVDEIGVEYVRVRHTSIAPGAHEGVNYLRYSKNGEVIATFDAEANTPGDLLHFETMVYIPGTDGAYGTRMGFYRGTVAEVIDNATTGDTWMTDIISYGPWHADPANNYILRAHHGVGGGDVTHLGFVTPDTWEKWEMDYAVGASTFDFALNGAWTTGIPITNAGGVSGVYFHDSGADPMNGLLDAVGVAPPSKNPGDVNGDLFVGGADLTKILDSWGMSPADWADGDIAPFDAGDDFVGGADYTQVLDNWGNSYAPESVPEPAAMILMLIGGLIGLTRRR